MTNGIRWALLALAALALVPSSTAYMIAARDVPDPQGPGASVHFVPEAPPAGIDAAGAGSTVHACAPRPGWTDCRDPAESRAVGFRYEGPAMGCGGVVWLGGAGYDGCVSFRTERLNLNSDVRHAILSVSSPRILSLSGHGFGDCVDGEWVFNLLLEGNVAHAPAYSLVNREVAIVPATVETGEAC